jgi:hypothetical protein
MTRIFSPYFSSSWRSFMIVVVRNSDGWIEASLTL